MPGGGGDSLSLLQVEWGAGGGRDGDIGPIGQLGIRLSLLLIRGIEHRCRRGKGDSEGQQHDRSSKEPPGNLGCSVRSAAISGSC